MDWPVKILWKQGCIHVDHKQINPLPYKIIYCADFKITECLCNHKEPAHIGVYDFYMKGG